MRCQGSPADAPLAQADPNALSIKIVAPDGGEVFFKIKKTTRLNKLKVGDEVQGGSILWSSVQGWCNGEGAEGDAGASGCAGWAGRIRTRQPLGMTMGISMSDAQRSTCPAPCRGSAGVYTPIPPFSSFRVTHQLLALILRSQRGRSCTRPVLHTSLPRLART